jgi:hypothetical protein
LGDVFLSVLSLDSVTADGYLDGIQKEVEKHRLLDCLSSCKLIGTGTDGAASMTAAENGLIQTRRSGKN